MRSLPEILFRIRQEASNLAMLAWPPAPSRIPGSPHLLPDGQGVARSVTGTVYARRIEELAAGILAHRFPVFDGPVETGEKIDWRRDYLHGLSSGVSYFRRIPYLDFAQVGDHKLVWELNRHQHLVVLAQAYLLSGDQRYLSEIGLQLTSWNAQNPWLRSVNWASALEVAFRALSWFWVDHLVGSDLPPAVREALLLGLYRHGRYLERNLSFYFSPNTHLLGEAVALHALGAAYPDWPEAAGWRRIGAEVVEQQMDRQVRPDGSHFEQSSYYHLYALDFFLLYAILEHSAGGTISPRYCEKLTRMVDFLRAICGPAGTLPMFGDDDGGRVFHPYGSRRHFAAATLATAALLAEGTVLPSRHNIQEQALWWVGSPPPSGILTSEASPARSAYFPDAGVIVLTSGDLHIVFDAGPFGPGSGGHSHSDTLGLVVRSGGEEILIDPGTYTYMSDSPWRATFRGSSAHNTLRIDGLEQAVGTGPFRWTEPPKVVVHGVSLGSLEDTVEASCSFGGFTHRRRLSFRKPGTLLLEDEVSGPPGQHRVEQFWHPGGELKRVGQRSFRISGKAELTLDEGVDATVEEGWTSPVYGRKTPSSVIAGFRVCTLPLRLHTTLALAGLDDK